MTSNHKKRLILIILLFSASSSIIALILFALRQNLNLFYTPTQIINEKVPYNKKIKIGGVVVKNSIKRNINTTVLSVQFQITDFISNILVKYNGILPDLFKEGQGVVVTGIIENQIINKKDKNKIIFIAEQVLAKHDENYMPPQISELSELPKG